MPIKNVPHKGASTHTHDHLIYPRSLRAMNKIVSKPINPIPDELDDELTFVDMIYPSLK